MYLNQQVFGQPNIRANKNRTFIGPNHKVPRDTENGCRFKMDVVPKNKEWNLNQDRRKPRAKD